MNTNSSAINSASALNVDRYEIYQVTCQQCSVVQFYLEHIRKDDVHGHDASFCCLKCDSDKITEGFIASYMDHATASKHFNEMCSE